MVPWRSLGDGGPDPRLKIKQEGLRRFGSMFPLAKGPFWSNCAGLPRKELQEASEAQQRASQEVQKEGEKWREEQLRPWGWPKASTFFDYLACVFCLFAWFLLAFFLLACFFACLVALLLGCLSILLAIQRFFFLFLFLLSCCIFS